jgi:Rad3-related DNA helicase
VHNNYTTNEKAKEIHGITKAVLDANKVVVPTDKTNLFVLMSANEYKQKVLQHLLKDRKEIPRERLVDAHEEHPTELLEEIEIFCSKNEYDFIKESL